jgi:hypothetical protein
MTREANPNKIDIMNEDEMESVHWRYCIKTDVKLIPTFLFTLAKTFIQDRENYQNVMDSIIKEIGKASDDGDSWVSMYGGYKIKDVEFSTEEGFDSSGFKTTTRSVLEEEASSVSLKSKDEKIEISSTPENKMILNVIRSITNFMGINIETHIYFIVKTVTDILSSSEVTSERDYDILIKENAKRGKKTRTYQEYYNSTLLYLTLGMILISIQINIPSIKTKKTFAGCVRSFTGYPVEGGDDFTGLKYISCIAYNISSSANPWVVLKKLNQEKIEQGIKIFVDKYLLSNKDIARKVEEKLEYLLLNISIEIPDEYSLRNWINFLPPLNSIIFKR